MSRSANGVSNGQVVRALALLIALSGPACAAQTSASNPAAVSLAISFAP